MSMMIPREFTFDIDKLLNNFWMPFGKDTELESGVLAPRVDIKENKDHYVITAELPGVKKDDVNISLEDGMLTISAETKHEEKEEKEGKLIRQERFFGRYVRSFNVGEGVQEKDIEADFKDGVLTLKTKKAAEEARPVRRIAVR